MGSEDHDLLIQINNNVEHLVKWADAHQKEDDERYKEVKKELEFGKKIFYGVVAIYFFLNIVTPFLSSSAH